MDESAAKERYDGPAPTTTILNLSPETVLFPLVPLVPIAFDNHIARDISDTGVNRAVPPGHWPVTATTRRPICQLSRRIAQDLFYFFFIFS
jgi:hypothetical protein